MFCFSGVMLERFGVKHGNAGGTRVEVDRVAAIMHRRVAVVVIQVEFARHAFQCVLDEGCGNSDHLVFRIQFCSCRREQLPRLFVLDLDARTQQQFVRLCQYSGNDLVTE